MTAAIDIKAEQRKTLLALLRRFIPGVAVWAYGSRVKWTARPNSDLDLVAFTSPAQRPRVSELKEALSESNLPFLVDLHVWDEVPEKFREIIRKEYVVLQESEQNGGRVSAGVIRQTGGEGADVGLAASSRNPTYGAFEQTTFAKLISEGALDIGDGYRAKNEELGGDGLIFLRAGHVTDTHIDFHGVDRFYAEFDARVRSKLAKPGDAVITTKGNSTGRTTYVSANMPEFVYSPHLSYWRSRNPTRIEGRFLRYWSKGAEFTDQLSGMKASTDMAPYLSLLDQKRLHISLPPIDEQRATAHILGTLDDKIELNRRMNETLEVMARALFKSWFVDFDPVRAKAEGRDPGLPQTLANLFPDAFEDSELGEIPKGWGVLSLDEIARFLNGLALQKYPPNDDGWLPVIKIAQLRAGNTDCADRASANLGADYIVEDGDILFSWSGSLECVLWAGGPGALNQHLFKVTSAKYPKWLCFLGVHQHLDNFQHIAAGKATTMGHIQRHHLSEAKLAIPPALLLSRMDTIMAPLVDSIWRRQVQSRTLAALRDTLLPKLISGELRLPDAVRLTTHYT